MNAWRKQVIQYKSINWLLIAAILLITFLPAHYHLHHLVSDKSSIHAHDVDLHLVIDKAEQSHHDTDIEVFPAAPDGITKNSNPAFSLFILLAILLILLPIANNRIRIRLDYSDNSLKQSYPHLSPPLRAPPLL